MSKTDPFAGYENGYFEQTSPLGGILHKANSPKAQARQNSQTMAPVYFNAKQRWDSAVKAEVARGKTRAQAVVIVARANPGLREQLLAEVNAGRNVSFGSHIKPKGQFATRLQDELRQLMEDEGLTRSAAAKKLRETRPELFQMVVQEANSGRPVEQTSGGLFKGGIGRNR